MAHYNSVSIKLPNSQLNKLKSATKSETGITLRLSPNMIDNSNDNFPINFNYLTDKMQIVIKPLRIIHQLI